ARFAITVSGDGLFQDWLRLKYGAPPEKLNAAWNTRYASRFDIRLPERAPVHPVRRTDWLKFVREELPGQFVAVDPAGESLFRRFLAQRYPDPGVYAARYGQPDLLHARMPRPETGGPPLSGVPAADWM